MAVINHNISGNRPGTGQSVFSVEDFSPLPFHFIFFSVSLNVKRIVSLSFAQTEESNICMYSFININVPDAFFQSLEVQLKDFTQERHTSKPPHRII